MGQELNEPESKILFITASIGMHDNMALLERLNQDAGTIQEIVLLRGSAGMFTSYLDMREQGRKASNVELHNRQSSISCHDVCNLQFTSGTTGNPKAAMLTH